MKFTIHGQHGKLLLSTVVILFVFVSMGCFQSNKSKIIGSWKTKSINNIDGNVQHTIYKFHKKGIVSKKTEFIIDDQLSNKYSSKIIGKYKFEDNGNRILITWDGKNTEVMDVNFTKNNKLVLGKYEMDKIK